MPLVALQGIHKIYGEGEAAVHALADVDLELWPGEFVVLMGASGSGKSTALNLLGCLDAPTSGTYHFSGVDVGRLDRDQRALLRRHYIGFVFQGFNLLPRTSALENVELPLLYRGLGRHERRQRAQRALTQVGLQGRERHKPNELSGGQQQRVAMARALVTEPTLLLADEPTGNLDSSNSHEIMRLLAELRDRLGITLVLVTHEADMAAYGDRVIEFVDGRIVDGRITGGPIPDEAQPEVGR